MTPHLLQSVDSFVNRKITLIVSVAIIFYYTLSSITFVGIVNSVHSVWPVAERLTNVKVFIEENNVRVTGNMYKRWNCVFIPPMHASSKSGQIFDVKSESPGGGRNWPAGKTWAVDWLVLGGRGHNLQLKAQYECFDLPLFSTVVEISSTVSNSIP